MLTLRHCRHVPGPSGNSWLRALYSRWPPSHAYLWGLNLATTSMLGHAYLLAHRLGSRFRCLHRAASPGSWRLLLRRRSDCDSVLETLMRPCKRCERSFLHGHCNSDTSAQNPDRHRLVCIQTWGAALQRFRVIVPQPERNDVLVISVFLECRHFRLAEWPALILERDLRGIGQLVKVLGRCSSEVPDAMSCGRYSSRRWITDLFAKTCPPTNLQTLSGKPRSRRYASPTASCDFLPTLMPLCIRS